VRKDSLIEWIVRARRGPIPGNLDEEYRRRAAAGELRTIAPRRFNPEKRSWLPILHTQRGRWHFTALVTETHGPKLGLRVVRGRELECPRHYDRGGARERRSAG